MRVIELNAKSGNTRVLVDKSFDNSDEFINGERSVVITDRHIGNLYKDKLARFERIEIGTGEKAKNLTTVKAIYDRFLELKVDRSSLVLGVGGGLVSDVAGFAASTYMRGIRFGFVPTTLLAQVDASLGGKNGVNFYGLKNMIGTIRQPEFCLIDFDFLNTLSRRQILSGLSEVIKCGAIADRELFKYLEDNYDDIISLDKAKLERAVSAAINVKMNVVSRDELETWERIKLNFGHTVGHAIETVTRIPHGYAVSIGMVAAAHLSVAKGLIASEEAARLEMLLGEVGLPTKISADIDELFKAISRDKKSDGDSINMVMLMGIGNATIINIQKEELTETLQGVCK